MSRDNVAPMQKLPVRLRAADIDRLLEYNATIKDLQAQATAATKALWERFYEAYGLDPKGHYKLDDEYLKQGVVFIKEQNSTDTFLRRILGGE